MDDDAFIHALFGALERDLVGDEFPPELEMLKQADLADTQPKLRMKALSREYPSRTFLHDNYCIIQGGAV